MLGAINNQRACSRAALSGFRPPGSGGAGGTGGRGAASCSSFLPPLVAPSSGAKGAGGGAELAPASCASSYAPKKTRRPSGDASMAAPASAAFLPIGSASPRDHPEAAADSGRADPGRADPGRADAGRADPGRADSGREKADAGREDAGREFVPVLALAG